ncbi:MAG: hypothetical protein Q7W56_07355 [Candidatus Latescibacteria bacterium]|nr:hypothetical protein [Candidatus Latescibacterota bacterium]
MEYELEYDEGLGVIVGRLHGELDAAGARRVASDLTQLVLKHDCPLFLIDLRDGNITRSTLEIYTIPRAVKDVGVPGGVKRALVVGGITEDFDFLETASLNAGNLVKLFTDPHEALAWLKG